MIESVEPSICELIGRIDVALAADDAEVSALKKQVSALRQELDRLKEIEAEKNEARREADLTLSQLHQSQQELHRYFLLCQKQSAMLKESEELQARSFALIAGSRK